MTGTVSLDSPNHQKFFIHLLTILFFSILVHGRVFAAEAEGEVITDIQLSPGDVIESGKLRGMIWGDASEPALINTEILQNSDLMNIVIGEDAVLGTPLIVRENVKFLSNDNIPMGTQLDRALGYIPGSGSGGFLPGIPDLGNSVLVDAFPLIEQLRAIDPAFEIPDGGLLQDEDGYLTLDINDLHFRLQPVVVSQVNDGLHERESKKYPGHSEFLLVFFDAELGVREQKLFPALVSYSVLPYYLSLDPEDDREAKLRLDGTIILTDSGGEELILVPDHLVSSTEEAMGFHEAGDLNNDGIRDYRVVYPGQDENVEQILYTWP